MRRRLIQVIGDQDRLVSAAEPAVKVEASTATNERSSAMRSFAHRANAVHSSVVRHLRRQLDHVQSTLNAIGRVGMAERVASSQGHSGVRQASDPSMIRGPVRFTIDIEATNRCNASCDFCPRDRMPHQGVMTGEVFAQALQRVIEFREQAHRMFEDLEITVTLCGQGEPLVNRGTPTFVRAIREAGFACAMSTNASLLDEARGWALLDAGLCRVFINAGVLDDTYERVYGLSFERTRDNISRFATMARGRCVVVLVIVGDNGEPERSRTVERYWRERGIEHFQYHDLFNRGGSLVVEHMQFAKHPHVPIARELLRDRGMAPICAAPFRFLFVGYDGQYYLCSMDWEKQVPLGSVFDESFSSVMDEKLVRVTTRQPICTSCSHDPLNALAETLRTTARPDDETPVERDALLASIAAEDSAARAIAACVTAAPTSC